MFWLFINRLISKHFHNWWKPCNIHNHFHFRWHETNMLSGYSDLVILASFKSNKNVNVSKCFRIKVFRFYIYNSFNSVANNQMWSLCSSLQTRFLHETAISNKNDMTIWMKAFLLQFHTLTLTNKWKYLGIEKKQNFKPFAIVHWNRRKPISYFLDFIRQ